MTLEDRIQAIRWKLGFPSSGEDGEQSRSLWEQLRAQPAFDQFATRVAQELARLLLRGLVDQLQDSRAEEPWRKEIAKAFTDWVARGGPAASVQVARALRLAIEEPTKPPPPANNRLTSSKAATGLHPLAGAANGTLPPSHGGSSPPAPTVREPGNVLSKNPAGPPAKALGYATHPPVSESLPQRTDSPPAPVTPAPSPPAPVNSTWRYRPLPNDPDQHAEYEAKSLALAAAIRVCGARVRGKKHKHDGTNCDDWFDFAQVGPWTLIAVSDGAGSKKFSRVGARAACEAAIQSLRSDLESHTLRPRETPEAWQDALNRREPGWSFGGEDVQAVQEAIHRAMRTAYDAVAAAAAARAGRPEYDAVLGRPVEVGDLSCTLLLAVRCESPLAGKDRDFVMACQVGDGLVGAVRADGTALPLGSADSGGYSGETEFLTSSGKLEPEYLARKTAVEFNPLAALLVMTDGVADDYFPAEPELSRLWADLILNGIVPPPPGEAVRLPEKFGYEAELIVCDGERPTTRVNTTAALADAMGLPAVEVARRPDILAGAPRASGPPAEHLRLWLDAYHVRGSFDDRTLVVLHREVAS